MNFAGQIARIQSAASDPRRLALAVLDIILAAQPPELRRVVEAAAALRSFNEAALAAVLDEDLRGRAAHWLELLKTLTAVEPAPSRDGWNVHENTRLALREQLLTQQPDRLAELAGRACAFFSGPDVPGRIEHAYHLVLADPAGSGPVLRALNFDLQANPEHALALAAVLGEYLPPDGWPPATRGWAAYFASVNRAHFRPLQASLADAELALACFQASDLAEGMACAHARLGDTLFERGLPGDAAAALGHYERSLEVRERLLKANPESAAAARDVSVSLNKLGDILARRGLPGDAAAALGHYERSLEVSERLLKANPESAAAARDVS
ncbi:MAG TPA: tetratricopeptide repeat protein, partial [Verrucomicrobiota bacterium]|nr:tetratricopeptide repeat protein [Verrucomicrobiota bacterium]